MIRRLSAALVLAVTSWSAVASGQSREVVLNYSDPDGAELALAMVLHAEQLPAWIRARSGGANRQKHWATVLVRRDTAALPQYTMSVPSTGTTARSSRAANLSAVVGNRIALRGAPVAPAVAPPCGTRPYTATACRLSDAAASVAVLLGASAPAGGPSLRDFVRSKGLAIGGRAVQRVVAALDERGVVEHVDFVGVLQRPGRVRAATDATPEEVLRVNRGGGYEVVRRQQDARVDLRDVRFGFEGTK